MVRFDIKMKYFKILVLEYSVTFEHLQFEIISALMKSTSTDLFFFNFIQI